MLAGHSFGGAICVEYANAHPERLEKLVLIATTESLGFRQLTAWWRVRAFWDFRRGDRTWGDMERRGLGETRVIRGVHHGDGDAPPVSPPVAAEAEEINRLAA